MQSRRGMSEQRTTRNASVGMPSSLVGVPKNKLLTRGQTSLLTRRVMIRSCFISVVLLSCLHMVLGQVDLFRSEVYKKRKGLVLHVEDSDEDFFTAHDFGSDQGIYKRFFTHANPGNFTGTIVDLSARSRMMPTFADDPYSMKRVWVYANTPFNKELILKAKLRFDNKVYLVSTKPDNVSILISEYYTITEDLPVVERVVEDWTDNRLAARPEYIWKRRVNMMGTQFNVGAMNYISMISLPDDNTALATGFCAELVRLLANSMNFTYDYKIPPRNVFGTQNERDEWTGLAGMVVRNEVDFTANLVPMSYERADEMNFSRGITMEQSVFVYKRNTGGTIPLERMFTPEVAIMFLVVFLVLLSSSVFISFLYRQGHLHAVVEVILTILASIMNQGFTERFSANSMRILLYTSLLLGILFVNILSARLASLLSVQLDDNPVTQFEDVIDKELNLYVLGQSSREEYFSLANPGSSAQYIWDTQLQDNPAQRLPTMSDVIVNAYEDEKGVIWTNPVVYKYWAVRNKSRACKMQLRRERRSIHHSLGVRKDWPFLQAMNYQLLKFREIGLINQLQEEWHYPQHLEQQSYCTRREEESKKVGIPDVKFYFFILCTGVGLCVIFFVGEIIGRRKHLRFVIANQKRKKTGSPKANKASIRTSMRSSSGLRGASKRYKKSSQRSVRSLERSPTASSILSATPPHLTYSNGDYFIP